MPFYSGALFQTTDPAVGDLLDRAITALIKQWRSDGEHNPPELPFATYVQSQLHGLAISETSRETSETTPTVGIRSNGVSLENRPATISSYEAAERLQISVQMVRRYVKADRLTAVRDGRSIRVTVRSVEALQAEREHKSA